MPSKICALGVCALIIGTASAHNKTYTVHQGDNDWGIAHKLGMTVAHLHNLNPSVDWTDLQIGTSLQTDAFAPAVSEINSKYAEVAADSATIRRSPSVDGDKITLVDKGTKAVVLKFQHGWYQLKFPKGTVGWMRADLLKLMPGSVKAASSDPAKKVDTVAALHKEHLAHLARLALLEKAARAKAVALKEKKTSAASKKKAVAIVAAAKKEEKPVASERVAAASAERNSSEPTDEQILEKAYRMRGTKYVYGGLSSRGLDCSGFTMTVYRKAGINLPRTSRSQSTVGTYVSRDELRPGDLVFFHTGRSSRINHVGMYVGNGRFIHASSGFGAVRVDSLAGHYEHEWVTSRRIPGVRHIVAGSREARAERSADASTSANTKANTSAKVEADLPELPPPDAVMKKSKPDSDVH